MNFCLELTYLALNFSVDLTYLALNLAYILHKYNTFNANPTYFALNFGVDFTKFYASSTQDLR